MSRTRDEIDDDAFLARRVVERAGRALFPHEIRNRMRAHGRPQSDKSVRNTLAAAARLGVLRQQGFLWEPTEGPPPVLGAADPAALAECAARLLAVRPCSAEINEVAGRLYDLAFMSRRPGSVVAEPPTAAALHTDTPPSQPSPSAPSNGASIYDDLGLEVFRPIVS